MGAEFYVYDYDSGEQLSDEICGYLNAFSTFNQALKICKKVSRKYNGRCSVQVAISGVIFEHGKEIEY